MSLPLPLLDYSLCLSIDFDFAHIVNKGNYLQLSLSWLPDSNEQAKWDNGKEKLPEMTSRVLR